MDRTDESADEEKEESARDAASVTSDDSLSGADDDGDDGSDDDFLRALAAAPDVRPSLSETLTQLAHFRIEERIGRGGMGIVFRAEDEKLRRTVALKVLPQDFGTDEKRRRRFMREARVAASISHPNVATVHEIGEADGRIYIAMELVSGTTLRHRLEKGPLPIAEALRMGKEIASAAAKAHERGIAHRDLKPDNVMVSDNGTIKVLDFGLAKPTEDAPKSSTESATLTQEGGIVGTPGYMSPEQATGRALDVRTDIFSLGVMLYEMVSGTRPFRGETSMDTLIATSRDPHRKLSELDVVIPSSFERTIDRCLEKDPTARYASAKELRAALDEIDLGKKSMPPAPAPSPPRAKWTPLIAVGAVAIAGLVTWKLASGNPSAPIAPESPPPSLLVSTTPTVATTATPIPTTTATPTTTSTATSTPTAISTTTPTVASGPRVVRTQAPSATASAAPPPTATAVPPPADTASAAPGGGVIQKSPY
jgi:serine/threonine-protein kinase